MHSLGKEKANYTLDRTKKRRETFLESLHRTINLNFEDYTDLAVLPERHRQKITGRQKIPGSQNQNQSQVQGNEEQENLDQSLNRSITHSADA